MTIHLLVAGTGADGKLTLPSKSEDTFQVAPCAHPQDLVPIARKAALDHGQMIDVLDIFDHGGVDRELKHGYQFLGDGLLWSFQGAGRFIARALRPLLTPDARVRLLGCNTAEGPSGRDLLLMLRAELGGAVVVYGTIDEVAPRDFSGRGFRQSREDDLLFSSTEALSREAPSAEGRAREMRDWQSSQLSART